MADKVLQDHLTQLKDGLTLPVIRNLLDDLRKETVLNREEASFILEGNLAQANKARSLINSVWPKGPDASRIMLKKLQVHDPHLYMKLNLDELLQPVYKTHAPEAPACTPMKPPVPTYLDKVTDEEYRMDSSSRGLCVIINNFKFRNPMKNLEGYVHDGEALKEVFGSLLGFEVEMHENLKAKKMEKLMRGYSKKDSHGDCFVCCVLSHGSEKGVQGVDGNLCTIRDILSPFRGCQCQALVGKPKLFFIQACRGNDREEKVVVSADDAAEAVDAPVESYTIASHSDFLVSMSTVEGFVSYVREHDDSCRGKDCGSWFIQSLCGLLKKGIERGEDILSILTKVNDEVSKQEGDEYVEKHDGQKTVTEKLDAKETPEFRSTLRKKVIFRNHHSSPGALE